MGPFLKRRWIWLCSLMVVALVAMPLASLAAELITAEITGTANDVTVTQGSSASFTIDVYATGNIAQSITSSNPAKATVDTVFTLTNGVLSSSTPSSELAFFASTSGCSSGGTVNCDVTWTGAPTHYSVPATISANSTTAVGTYSIVLSASAGTTDETNPSGSGGKLGDGTATTITVHVVAPTCTAPSVTTNPLNQTVTYGANASFTAAASGSPAPSVQWQVSTDGGTTFSNISGATSATLPVNTPTVSQSGSQYRAVFTNSCTPSTATTNAATLTVNKAAATATLGTLSFIYDGTAKSTTATTVPSGLSVDITYDGSATAPTDAGSYAVVATINDANYQGATSGTLTIAKASSTTTVSCPSSVTYNGSAQTPCSATVTGAGALNQSLTVNYTNNTNAGTATASASFVGDANYETSSDSEDFTIDKASSTTTVTCLTSVTYTGSAQTPCTASVTGAGGLSEALTVSYSDNTNAGTATASASYAGDTNHESSSNSATFEITKATSSVTVNCPASVEYNGSDQTPCTASYSTSDGLSGSLMPSYLNNMNAGTATASASYAGDTNHESSNNSATFEIAKATSSVTVICPSSVYFTGAAQTPCTASYSTSDGLSGSLTPSYSNNTNVGTATASASYVGDSNHESSSKSKNFTILGWTANGFYQPVDMNGVLNTVKNGSTVPLKFEVFAGTTELVDPAIMASMTAIKVNCTTGAEDAIEEVAATASTTLRYDTTAGQFIFNWKTPKTANICYNVTFTFNDGSSLSASFKLK